MATIQNIFRRLRKIDDPVIDRSLAVALETTDPASARMIALLLLERRNSEACAALVCQYHRLPHDVQQTIIKHADLLDSALRIAAGRKNTLGPAGAVEIISHAQSVRLAYLVVEQMRHGSGDLPADAAECLKTLAVTVATDPAPGARPPCEPDAARFVQQAVEEAIVTYHAHQQPDALVAYALLCPRAMFKAKAAMEDVEHAAVRPLRALLSRPDDADVRAALLACCCVPTLTGAVMAGLRHCAMTRSFDRVLENWHLLHKPMVRQVVRQLPDTDQPDLLGEDFDSWPTCSSRGVATWITAAAIPFADQVNALQKLALHPDPSTRLAALSRLVVLSERSHEPNVRGIRRRKLGVNPQHSCANSAIEQFCFDSEASIARVGLRQLARCRWQGLADLLLRLVNADNPEIRRYAQQYLAPIGFDRYWNNWPQLSIDRRIAAGRALIKIDPCFHQHIAKRLELDERDTRLRAINMIGTLAQGAFFEAALLTLVNDDDEAIVSASVKALGSADSDEALRALHGAMAHRNSRVRANAIEALQQLESGRHVEQLEAMAIHEDNRPRANAIAHLLDLRSGEAINALRMMLGDDRQSHRDSALWLVETAGLIDVARNVAELAITDPDPKVKQRAAVVVDKLIKSMGRAAASEALLQNAGQE